MTYIYRRSSESAVAIGATFGATSRAFCASFLLTGLFAGLTVLSGTKISQAEEAQASSPLNLSEIVVRGRSNDPLVSQRFPLERMSPETDGGAYLRTLTGVSAGRMGGHGTDPIIRGQSQNRLNVLNDGAQQYGACPNRMDPPTSFINLDTYDRVTVLKGYQSVLYGAGGTGGTVLFERDPVRLQSFAREGRASLGYESNGNVRRGAANGLVGNEDGAVRGNATFVDAQSYQDGDGNSVASSYEQWHGGLGVSLTPGADRYFSLDVEQDQVTDALFPGAGMDSPLSDSVKLSAKSILDFDGVVSRLRLEAFGSVVDHVMDNYTLRPFTAMRARRVDSTSDTYGGRFIAELDVGEGQLSLGMDAQRNEREALRFDGANGSNVSVLQNLLWPDVAITQFGVFGEGNIPLSDAAGIKLGLRYDHVTSDARKANQVARVTHMLGGVMMSANDLYRAHYGVSAAQVTDHNVSGLARLELDVTDLTTVFTGISHSMRSPDATERYLANFMGAGGVDSWVGNPNLDPERHVQLDAGFVVDGGAWGLSGAVYYDRVQDYILRDRARGQAGIITNNSTTTIYRNVRATLAGGEIEARHAFAPGWEGLVGLAYTYGQNETDNRALAQIAPLELSLEVTYGVDDWKLGSRVTAAAGANRVDTNPLTGTGLDAGKTPGWASVDVFGEYDVLSWAAVEVGVSNLFDADYAYHLNREDIFSGTSVQVDEPGRSGFVKLTAKF
ncbi:MAG: TonB-dependent copper receptor [Parvibaculum sp.]